LRTIVEEGAVLPLGIGSAGHVLAGEPSNRAGWIQSVGERRAGVASVSAAVMASGVVVGAVSVSGPVDRVGRDPGRLHGAAVAEAARLVSARLG